MNNRLRTGIVNHGDDQYNQLSKAPTPAPSGDSDMHDALHPNAVADGTTAQINAQNALNAIPTAEPTAFPTKINNNQIGSTCTSGSITKNVGWVGAGPGSEFCNVWKCTKTGFTKQTKTCSVEANAGKQFCSHTTCTFGTNADSAGKYVIMVRSDHRETTGGLHICGYAKHDNSANHVNSDMGDLLNDATDRGAQTAARPACDCVCEGARRQDANGFARDLVSHNDNTNNFYSQHSNNNALGTQVGVDSGYVASEHAVTSDPTTYSENDHTYLGQQVSHKHIES